MYRKYKIFLSSTYTELKSIRTTAILEILNLGYIPVGMENFIAGRPSMDIIKEEITHCDAYILIAGEKYGSIYKNGKSYTQHEYELAKSLQKPMFAIVKKLSKTTVIEDEQKNFRELVCKDQCAFYTNKTNFKLELGKNLPQLLKEHAQTISGYIDCSRSGNYAALKLMTVVHDEAKYELINNIFNLSTIEDSHTFKIINNPQSCKKILAKLTKNNLIPIDECYRVFLHAKLEEHYCEIIKNLQAIALATDSSIGEELLSELTIKLFSNLKELKSEFSGHCLVKALLQRKI